MKQLIIETKKSLLEYIPRLIQGSESIGEALQSGEQYKAMKQLPDLFEGIQWITSALKGIEKNHYSFNINTAELNGNLKEMEDALKNQDFVLLADLLEYEISPILEDWLNKIEAFKV
ncbi:hypothetical protein CR203_07600 [Salipaludibacillus neizhouensis]|uniref:DUF8042 domain-containing protein n=1 Tax=Salipaludibacillus neizhouensis TaxID=885475 RepID=A0A3A9KUS5_9BACI|nr:hypothetical protein [Salipaludibacillus neizhouensis]RKL68336.1 hypothetical protein CR203_07600 [Salipaludibacillus neizhouensis]